MTEPRKISEISNYYKGFVKNLILRKPAYLIFWDADQADRADTKEKNPYDPRPIKAKESSKPF